MDTYDLGSRWLVICSSDFGIRTLLLSTSGWDDEATRMQGTNPDSETAGVPELYIWEGGYENACFLSVIGRVGIKSRAKFALKPYPYKKK